MTSLQQAALGLACSHATQRAHRCEPGVRLSSRREPALQDVQRAGAAAASASTSQAELGRRLDEASAQLQEARAQHARQAQEGARQLQEAQTQQAQQQAQLAAQAAAVEGLHAQLEDGRQVRPALCFAWT